MPDVKQVLQDKLAIHVRKIEQNDATEYDYFPALMHLLLQNLDATTKVVNELKQVTNALSDTQLKQQQTLENLPIKIQQANNKTLLWVNFGLAIASFLLGLAVLFVLINK